MVPANLKPFKITTFLRLVVLSFLLTALSVTAGQVMHGQIPSATRHLQAVDRLDGSTRLNLAIGLPLRNQETLTNLLRDLYDPASPRFHQYLTAAQFAQQFGPTERDYQAVMRFAQAHGLTVTGTHPNRTLLDVSGAVADIEKTLHLHMRTYQHPTEARRFYAPDAEPSLDLDVPVLAISGLDNFVLPHPMNLKTAAWNTGTNMTAFVSGSGPGGFFIGSDFRAAYAPGVALNGGGQAVGLFELDGYYPSDIADYETLAKLPNVALTNILLDGFSGTPGSANIEVALDIDMAICMAPGLFQVMIYEGTTPNDVLNRMATDDQAKQLSSSWGFPINASTELIYLQFAAQGQSIFQASGDNGAYPGTIQTPCDDPNVTSVGGTSLTTSGPGGAWAAETVWSGSGGGISTSYTIPAWQTTINMTANHGSTTKRNIPDVSCLADISIWLIAFNGEQGAIGGSSASTPLWAGFAALANQQAAANGRPSIGFINPAIYAIGQGSGYTLAFHDITTGNNTNASSPTNFFAVPGYDLCTGWGSPAGSNLINALALPPDALQILPATTVVASGPVGGPFSPAGATLVLTNIGVNWLNWALGSSSTWLNVFPGNGSGTLMPGSPAVTVTLSLNSAANTLPAGSYPATVRFTNLSDGFVQSREFVLDVVAPPVINQQPVSQSVPLGGSATFTVGTTSNALLFFQWRFNGTNLTDGSNILGSASRTLTITNVTAANAGTYTVVVSNAANVAISDGASLTITSSAPVIISQPVNQAAPQGGAAIFTVAAEGNAPLTYQWQWDTTNLADGGSIAGSSSSALTITNISPANAGTYSVIVSNALGSTPSANASLTVVSLTAPGVTLSTLYSFSGGLDGGNPNGLMQETNGNFYDTTQMGGSNASGTVFQMTPAGTVTTLDWFNSVGSAGSSPGAALVQGPDGILYGTTQKGGSKGFGTIFKTTTNGVLAPLLNFNATDGIAPIAAMIVGADGALYGTTKLGGTYNDGLAFRITTTGARTILGTFNKMDGAQPTELLQAANGSFYGTTIEGGANGNGSIFQIDTNGTLTSLASFNYTNGGSLPFAGVVQTPDGNFFGTTYEGGTYGYGTVFQMSPSSVITTLYSFTGMGDGGHPAAALTLGNDGNFYGTTAYGGTDGDGTVFRLAPNGALVSLVQFDGYDGANPEAALVLGSDGNFYGTTENGGTNGMGAIFRLNINSPTLQISGQPVDQDVFAGVNAVFSVAVIGNPPFSYQWKEDGTNLTDGAGISGSTNRVLTLFNVTPANTAVYSVLVSNAGNSVLSEDAVLGVIVSPPQITVQPVSQNLLVGGTAVFSVTAIGDVPLTYQWQKNGTNLTDGGQINGSSTSTLTITNLFETNSGTYSVIVSNLVASVASADAVLTVVAVSYTGTTVVALYSFTGGNDGGVPNGLVLGSNGLLYGTTQNGGLYGDGTIFSLSTKGTLTTLVAFNGTNGATPLASLAQGTNGLFYGTTELGGSNGAGTIFSMNTNGTVNSIYSFASNIDSIDPFTSLTQDAAGNFYGATENNAAPGDGNIFKMPPGGPPATLYSFTGGLNGTLPAGALALGKDGNLYGMTGTNAETTNIPGNVFKMTPGGVVTNLYSFTGGSNGFSPVGQLVQGDDGNFYGVTRFNQIQNNLFLGTIFRITPGGALTTLYSLDGLVVYTDGAIPDAGLIQGSDGNFYGTTLEGYNIDVNGAIYNNSYGTVFRITPAGTLTTLTALNDSDDGAYPEAALAEGADGALYGTTTSGGAYGQGAIFKITFTSAPQINTQPASQTNVVGGRVTFYVTVFGAPQLFYQWQQNGTNLTDGSHVSGSAARVLTLNNITSAQAGTYSVIVSNALGSVTSSGALLTVEAVPIFQTAAQAGGTFAFTWTATPPQIYQVQATTNLSSGIWTNFGNAVTATNGIMGASEVIGTNRQKFYRVIMSP